MSLKYETSLEPLHMYAPLLPPPDDIKYNASAPTSIYMCVLMCVVQYGPRLGKQAPPPPLSRWISLRCNHFYVDLYSLICVVAINDALLLSRGGIFWLR